MLNLLNKSGSNGLQARPCKYYVSKMQMEESN